MKKNFPVILCELRKSAGLSQKEAAASLGISQALLSHYEKGIRECGQGFLIKAADFYGVTCDYLLGRSNSKTGLSSFMDLIENPTSEIHDHTRTVLTAGFLIREIIYATDNRPGVQLDKIASLELYKLLIKLASANVIPHDWAGCAFSGKHSPNNEMFLDLIDSAVNRVMKVNPGRSIGSETLAPDAIKTMVSIAENCLFDAIERSVPEPSD